MKVLAIYNGDTGSLLAVQYGAETAYSNLKNKIFELEEGQSLVGVTIDGENATAVIEENETAALKKEIASLTATVEYLSMLAGVETTETSTDATSDSSSETEAADE